MAKLIANINGKDVYSDKLFSAIKGGRVEFEDGSWCDVSTGQVVNRGKGYITIGSPPNDTGPELVTKGPLLFRSQVLEVSGVHAKVSIEPHAGDVIEVTISGEQDAVEAIVMNESKGCLVISGQPSRATKYVVSGATVISGRVFDSIVNNVVLTAGGGADLAKVDIKVPQGAPVRLNRVRGKTEVGDTLGPLLVNLDGSNQIQAGKVTDTDLLLSGSGRIRIAETNGHVNINLVGSAQVRIDRGAVSNIKVDMTGSGNVNFGGKAQDADVRMTGSGNVSLAYVENRPHKVVIGSGNLSIGNR